MITVHDSFAAGVEPSCLGLGAVFPARCTVTEEAGGPYWLSLTHPLDAAGAWKLLQPLRLLCVPVPVCDTPMVSAADGGIAEEGIEVWRAGGGGAGFYRYTSGTVFPAYRYPYLYSEGDRMRWNGVNYECVGSHAAGPSPRMTYWQSRGTGAPRPAFTLEPGTQFAVSGSGGGWLTVRLQDGTKGWCRPAECEYMYTAGEGSALPGDVNSRRIREQLFRITDVEIDTAAGTVTCGALHISYDWSAVLADSLILDGTPLTTAAAALRSAVLPGGVADAPRIYVQDTGCAVTGTYRRTSVTAALLDPDDGFVAQGKAMLIRDNRDFFLLRNERRNRGLRLEYGVNMLGVRWKRDCAGLVTRVCPVARDAAGADYTLPERFVDSARVGSYPFPMAESLDVPARIGRGDETEETVRARMLAAARRRFEEDGADLPAVSLSVDLALPGNTEERRGPRQPEKVCLYDTVEVVHPGIGLHVTAQVRAYEWDALRERLIRLELGDVFGRARHTVAGYDLGDGCVTARKLSPGAMDRIRDEIGG